MKKAPSIPKKKKSLLKVKGKSRTTLAPYGRDEYLEAFRKFRGQGLTRKQAQAKVIDLMEEDSYFEMKEYTRD